MTEGSDMKTSGMPTAPEQHGATELQNVETQPEKVTVSTNSAQNDHPEGGRVAWTQVAVGFFIWFNTFGVLYLFGNFQTYYEEVLLPSKSASDLSWIGTVQSSFIFFGSIYSGPLYDMGYTQPLMLAGSFFEVLGMFTTSAATKYWQVMLARGVCMGLGIGCLFTPSLSLIGSYFKLKMPLAITIAASGATLGGVIYPLIFIKFIESHSFGWTVRAIAFVMLGISILLVTGIRQRMKPASVRKFFILYPLKEPAFALYLTSVFLCYIGEFVPFFYIQRFTIEKCNIESNLYLYMLVIMNAAGLPGRLFFGILGQRIGPLHSYTLSGLASVVLLFGWIRIHDKAGVIVWSLLYGFISSGIIAMPAAVLSTALCPDIKQFTSRVTVGMVGCGLGFLIGNPIAGATLKHSWVSLQVFSAAVVLAGTLCSFAARAVLVGFEMRRKC